MKQLKKLILPLLVALFVSSTGLYAAFAESSVKSVSYTVENVTSGISDENVTVTDLNGNEVNLAAGPHGGTGAKSVFTDGVISSTQTAMLVDGEGKGVIGYITVDAGAVYTVNRVLIDIVHDWGANDFTLELSETSDFENSRVVFSNKQGNATTADKSYNTSGTLMNVPYQGLTFNFSPVRARYIRVTGNTVGNGAEQGYTCIGEIQMYAITSGAPVWANAVSGRYNAFELAFGTESENAKIYYTLDGSAPNKNSTEYTGPIVLEKGEYRFRAVSYENGVYGYPFDFDYTVSGSIFNSVNVALRKTVTAYGLDGSVATPATLNGSDNIQSLTNGDKGLFDAFTFDKLAFVQVDLGESVWTDTVYLNLWNNWVFRQIVIQISDDENFENYTTLVNTGNYGNLDTAWVSGEYSVSPEFNEGEWKQHSADGWTFTFAPVKGRYVRATNQNGNGAGYFSVFTEMEVWTCEAPEATEYEIGVNIARGKTVTAYGLDGSEISVLDLNGGGTLGAVVDGTKGLFNSIQLEGLGWIQVDFGVSAWINRVDLTLWHDWVFREITVQISDTEDFSTFTTILCTGNNGHTDNAWVGGEYTATP
ncbi:MAG: chitobiase/beta-hexosaminidase C-terminal domain-containing protein, partial [Clostridia bacterium]|nr:chitobiase/beta-hexosaminidase C-terminal domain-containing protein [Clostridia bacterium]